MFIRWSVTPELIIISDSLDVINEDSNKPSEKTDDQKTSLDGLDEILPGLPGDTDVDQGLSQGLAQIDSKTLEDLFKGVLNEGNSPAAQTQGEILFCTN